MNRLTPSLEKITLSSTIDTGNPRQIAFVEWGDRNNPRILVCVHGLTRNSRDFDYLAQHLASKYRIIAVDIAGRGRSDLLTHKTEYHYGTYVADMVELLQQLNLSQVEWVGTSMGGLIGMLIAARYPHLIRKMVMNDIGPFIPASTLIRIGKYVGIYPHFADMKAAEKHLRMILAPFGIQKDEDWAYLTAHSVWEAKEGGYHLAYDPSIADVFKIKGEAALEDVSWWPVWDQVTCDTLLLRGALSDALLPETARKMQLTGPRAHTVEFPGIGHAPALMESSQIEVVASWLLDR